MTYHKNIILNYGIILSPKHAELKACNKISLEFRVLLGVLQEDYPLLWNNLSPEKHSELKAEIKAEIKAVIRL